ncbi:FAD-dependent monooxygenase, partial [Escherichia coli]|uniref:FAD-dependent monooxygenase n=1 Tax=Escherichia coli TaxID=562 RepID=UPI0039DF9609
MPRQSARSIIWVPRWASWNSCLPRTVARRPEGRTSLIRYLSDCDSASLQDYPVCVVGSGPGGLSLAVALSRQGQRVL